MKKYLVTLLLLLLPAIAWLVQPGYFPMHDDLQVMRQLVIDKCFRDFQIPCRWNDDMGYGYGYPIFNYYPPLPYYLGHIFRVLGFAYIDVVKIVGIVGFIAAAVAMFYLAREFFGNLGGLLAAVFYTYAPYHSVDYYVRAAVNEFYALVFFPLIFLFSYKLIYLTSNPSPKLGEGNFKGVRYVVLLAMSVAGLMLSHNPMLMIFIPGFMLWIFYWWWHFRSVRSFGHLAMSALWALGLAAFFTLPVVFEAKYAHIETLVIGYFNFLAHFLDWRQIFLRINWGYGESILGPKDTMSFALGHLHWIIPLTVGVLFAFMTKLRKYRFLLLLQLLLFGSLFMAHFKATFIWQHIKPLEFLQFPWRMLTLSIFAASFISGAYVVVLRKSVPLLLLLLLLLNANYFRPRDWWPQVTDASKLSGESWRLLLTAGIFDYLPIFAKAPPAGPPGGDVEFLTGAGDFRRIVKNTKRQVYAVQVASDLPAKVLLNTYFFPGWQLSVDGKDQPIDPQQDPGQLGRFVFTLPKGDHTVQLQFVDTPIRLLGNFLSVVSWGLVLGIIVPWRKWSWIWPRLKPAA